MLRRLEVPDHLHRNDPGMAALGYERTGKLLIDLATRRLGRRDLRNADILDVGCGVRFTQAIINWRIPVRSYTGIDVSTALVDFLRRAVEAEDTRFRFVHLDVQSAMYNAHCAVRLDEIERMPVAGSYDVIWLFSVFTHLDEREAAAMLRLLRSVVRPAGHLFFSAFIDPQLTGFEDRVPGNPLLRAHFGRATMEGLIHQAGWAVEGFYERDPDNCIMDYFVCQPKD